MTRKEKNLLGRKMYAVIGKRHGKILSGDLTQGSGNFFVSAILPVIESFNFAQEIRKQTSGLACPQLMFSHWEIDLQFMVKVREEERNCQQSYVLTANNLIGLVVVAAAAAVSLRASNCKEK
uniref:Elongation factor EFG domain-containing protein n=1 Tax=Glossina brevipalpis TaxID=37001 RepID=A0A1A9W3A3_9MUSC